MNHKDTQTQRKRPNDLSYRIIGFCMEIRRALGPGLLESVHEEALARELKAANALLPVHHAQLPAYLKLARRSLGLLINFNEPVLKDGVRRIVCGDLSKDEVLSC